MKTPASYLIRSALCALLAVSVISVSKADNSKDKKVPAGLLKKYDTNKDGVLDDTEKAAMEADKSKEKAAKEAKLLEKYDANKDGKLDETELAAQKADMKAAADKRKAEQEKKKAAAAAAAAAATPPAAPATPAAPSN